MNGILVLVLTMLMTLTENVDDAEDKYRLEPDEERYSSPLIDDVDDVDDVDVDGPSRCTAPKIRCSMITYLLLVSVSLRETYKHGCSILLTI